jgi:hypothetical protein
MRTMRTIQALTVAVLLVACCSAALGAESAQALLNKGNKAFSQGDYARAYRLFTEGYGKAPSPAFLRNIGYALLKMYKHEEARKTFKEYLTKYGKEKDRKNIEEVLKNLEVVVTTRIKVTSTPPGAALYIDAEASDKVGVTPYEATIEPGRHTVILKLAGYHTTTKTFTIAAGKMLAVPVGMEVTFKVRSNPSGAVHLGSASSPTLGSTPYSGGIGPGKQTVFIAAPGYKTFRKELNVAGTAAVVIDAGELRLGLKVASKPVGATVEIDGQKVEGVTPLEADITTGSHRVTVSLEGYRPHSEVLQVVAGKDASIDIALTGGLLSMRANVDGAKVKVGEVLFGDTPLERAGVPLGKRTVTVEHATRRPVSLAVDFEENQLVDAKVKLGAPMWPVWTALGATVVGAVLWTVGGVMAMQRSKDYVTVSGNDSMCTPKAGGSPEPCSYTMHNIGTAGTVITGVSAGTGLLYYLIWGRSSYEVKKVPASSAASTSRRSTVN